MQSNTRVVLSHVSALPFHGGPMWGMPVDMVHVTRPDGRAGRAEAGVRQHQGALAAGDVVVRHGMEIMSATRTALDITTCVNTEAALVVVDDFLHRSLTTLVDLRERYVPMVHDPYTLRTDLVLRLADPRQESIGESRTFWMLYRRGVPAPVPQHVVLDPLGQGLRPPRLRMARARRLAGVRRPRKVRETPSVPARQWWTPYSGRRRRESRIAELTGWRCIRITWADLERPGRHRGPHRGHAGRRHTSPDRFT